MNERNVMLISLIIIAVGALVWLLSRLPDQPRPYVVRTIGRIQPATQRERDAWREYYDSYE